MINPWYGSFSCGLDGETFQVLIPTDPVFNEETGEMEDRYIWDEEASAELMWDHWWEAHDKDRDGVLDE